MDQNNLSVPNSIFLQEIVLWILLFGSMFVFDSHLPDTCREAKDLFQLPLVATFIGLQLWKKPVRNVFGIRKSTTDRALLIVVGFSLLTFIWSPLRLVTLHKLVNLVLYSVFYFALRRFLEMHADADRTMLPLCAAAALSSVYAFFQYAGLDPIFHPAMNYQENRWMTAGFTGQQTLFAGVIGPLIAPLLLSGIALKQRWKQIFYIISAILICIAVVLSHTRAILLGFGISLVAGLLLLAIFNRRNVIRRLALPVITLICISICTCIILPTFKTRLLEGITLTSPSIRARLHYWECSWELIKEKPWIGWGWGSFSAVYPDAQIKIRTNPEYRGYEGDEIVTHPHNEFLLVLTEGGILLLMPVLVLTISVFSQGFQRFFSMRDKQKGIIELGYLLGMIIFIVDALFSFPMHVGTSGLIGILLAAFMTRKQDMPFRDSGSGARAVSS
jgi:O-antigen ligase